MTCTTLWLVMTIALVASCTGTINSPEEPPDDGSSGTTGGTDNTFDYENCIIDPWELLDTLQCEGLPRYMAWVYSCNKMCIWTIGNLLAGRGVNLGATGATSAAQLLATGYNVLGGPNYSACVREASALTTASASRLFDIFAAAVPEMIASFESLLACSGAGPLFNASNQCQAVVVMCLLGVPATTAHLELCNLTVQSATTIVIGQ